jgi:hypothetical protein
MYAFSIGTGLESAPQVQVRRETAGGGLQGASASSSSSPMTIRSGYSRWCSASSTWPKIAESASTNCRLAYVPSAAWVCVCRGSDRFRMDKAARAASHVTVVAARF